MPPPSDRDGMHAAKPNALILQALPLMHCGFDARRRKALTWTCNHDLQDAGIIALAWFCSLLTAE